MLRSLSFHFVQTFIVIGILINVASGLTGSEAVINFFDYFQSENPLGIPVLHLDDPREIYSPLELIPITVIDGKVKGHSQIKIHQFYMNFLSLHGSAKITAPKIEMYGDYSWPGFIYSSEGFMNATMINVTLYSNFTLEFGQDGLLRVTDLQINQENEHVDMNMTNLVWEHELIFSTGAVHVFFDEILLECFRQLRPFLISEANSKISEFLSTLPRIQSFLSVEEEQAITASGGSKSKTLAVLLNRVLSYMALDPVYLPNRSTSLLGFKVKVTDMVMHGASTIDNVDSLFVVYQEKTIFVEFSMRFSKLLLLYKIVFVSAGNVKRSMRVQLNEVNTKMRLTVDPSLKTPPKIKYFDIYIGSFGKLRSSRKRNFWKTLLLNVYDKVEAGIMNEVVNALQGPLTKIVQKELNAVDIENSILQVLAKTK